MRKLLEDVFVSDTVDFVNIYYLREKDRFIVIDAGVEKDPSPVIEEIKGAGWSPSELRGIVITHGHPDHTGCAQALSSLAGCNIFMSAEDNKFFDQNAVALKDGDLLPFFGGLEVIFCPGHTDGSVALYQRERKIMFFGDQGRVGEEGLTLSVPEHYNKDTARAYETVKRLILSHDIETAFFGHGAPLLSNANEDLAKAKGPKL